MTTWNFVFVPHLVYKLQYKIKEFIEIEISQEPENLQNKELYKAVASLIKLRTSVFQLVYDRIVLEVADKWDRPFPIYPIEIIQIAPEHCLRGLSREERNRNNYIRGPSNPCSSHIVRGKDTREEDY